MSELRRGDRVAARRLDPRAGRRAAVGEGRLAVGRVGQGRRTRWRPGSAGSTCPRRCAARVAELEHLARDIRDDGYRRAAVLGHGRLEPGARALQPRLRLGRRRGRLAARHRPTASSCASSTPPIPMPCAASVRGPRRSARSSASARSRARRPSRTPSRPRWARSRRRSTSSPSPIRARALAELARAQEFRAIVEAPAGRRRPLLGAHRLRPRAGGARTASTSVGCWSARVAMADACRAADAASNPGLRAGRRHRRGRAGRPRQAHDPHLARGWRAFGDWAEQLVAESTGKAGTGIVPIVGEPIARARALRPTTAASSCVTLDEARPEPRARRAGWRQLEGLGHPVDPHRAGRPARPRRRVRALGGRDRRRRDRARDRPVRPAQRAGVEGRHARSCSRRFRAQRRAAGADADRERAGLSRSAPTQRSWATRR